MTLKLINRNKLATFVKLVKQENREKEKVRNRSSGWCR